MQQLPELWDEPVYVISAAAEMVALHPQTLRRYEGLGLLKPARKSGRRLYSRRDIETVRYIVRLSDELGLNLAGVEVIMRLQEHVGELQSQLDELHTIRAALEAQVAALQDEVRRLHDC